MREFMFRVWDKRNNKWINDTESIYINSKGEICELSAAHYYGETWLDEESIDSEVEVNFFTGLYDKNLNPIYEGDILEFGYIVTYVDGSDQSNLGMDVGFYAQRDDFESYGMLEIGAEYEVMGNIYEKHDEN